MSALTLLLIRLAFLAILWLFVIAAVGVVRTDMFGIAGIGRKARNRQRQRQPKPARPARSARGEAHRLLVTAGALAGTSLGLTDQQITVGRANDATLVLNDDSASSRHARLFPQDGQ